MSLSAVPATVPVTTEFTYKKPFKILALDGGGVRGVLEAVILDRLVQEFPSLISEVDMFAGVSAGSIVSLALANGLTPKQTVKFFEDDVKQVFTEGAFARVRSLDNAFGACYQTEAMRAMLEHTLGTKTLADLEKKVLILSFNLNPQCDDGTDARDTQNHRWTPEHFHNFPFSNNADTPLIDCCLRSTAAPTYFPIYQGYVDGGIFANNPALSAVATAMLAGVKIEDIVVFSLSTGNNPRSISEKQYGSGNWGLIEWAPHIVELLLDATTQNMGYLAGCMLRDRYCRVDPLLTTDIGLDNSAAVPQLEDIASKVDLSQAMTWLEQYWGLKRGNPQPDNSDAMNTDSTNKAPDTTNANAADSNTVIPSNNPNDSKWGCSIQ